MAARLSIYNPSGTEIYTTNTAPDGFLYDIYTYAANTSGTIYLPQYSPAGAGVVNILSDPRENRVVQDNSNGYPGVIINAGLADCTFLLFVFTF